MLFQQFLIDPIVLVILLIMRHYKLVQFTIMEATDL